MNLETELIGFTVPILRHQKWLNIKYPEGLSRGALMEVVNKNLPKLIEQAKVRGIDQLKVVVNPNWVDFGWRLSPRFKEAVYFMSIGVKDLLRLRSQQKVTVVEVSDVRLIESLIKDQFEYHQRAIPEYYTDNVTRSAADFVSLANKAIQKEESFCLAIKKEDQFAGFIYYELCDQECYVDELYIAAKWRGKGFGKQLVVGVGDRVIDSSIKVVTLHAVYGMPAVGFYEKIGFSKESLIWFHNIN